MNEEASCSIIITASGVRNPPKLSQVRFSLSDSVLSIQLENHPSDKSNRNGRNKRDAILSLPGRLYTTLTFNIHHKEETRCLEQKRLEITIRECIDYPRILYKNE